MSSLLNTIVGYVDEQLQAMFAAPGMWGSNEGVELQVIQLLETRSVALRPELEKRAPRTILDAYHAFLEREFPDPPHHPLYCLVDEFDRKDDFIPLLRKFSAEIIASMAPEDIFETHDLVLRLWLRDYVRVPRASVLSTYYDVFRRVLRAVSRPVGARGRARHALEEAIDFAMPDVTVVAANGEPAHVVLPLDQIEKSSDSEVRQGLAQIVAINEWAAKPDDPLEVLSERLPERTTAQHVAAQALRLLPSQEAAVEVVEFGGKLVGRSEPVPIRPYFAARMVNVVREEGTLREFDQVGSVRAVDFDQRSLRLRVGRRSIKCWMADESALLDVAKDALGRRVRIIGQEYKELGSPPMVIVKSIQ